MSQTIFLSTVTGEFGTVRQKLAAMFGKTKRVHVRHQDDFEDGGVRTLHMLEEEVKASDSVLHLIGNSAGWVPRQDQVEEFLTRQPTFAQRFPDIAATARKGELSATQWEAWLAIFFSKRLMTYRLQTPAVDKATQDRHVAQLKAFGVHPKEVADLTEFLESVIHNLAKIYGLSDGEMTKICHLPYAPLGELFIGRDDTLQQLWNAAEPCFAANAGKAWPKHVLFGMGGIGKTRLAVEYGYRREEDYSAVLFATAESEEQLKTSLANLVGALVPDFPADNKSRDEQYRAVLHWLKHNPG